jgi:hypothetical protein
VNVLLIGLAILALGVPASAQDVVHDQVQKFLDVLHKDGDFANSEFKDAVKPTDAVRLKGFRECDLDSVRRSEAGTSAIILFICPMNGRTKRATVMMDFDAGKTVAIVPVSFVDVPERG